MQVVVQNWLPEDVRGQDAAAGLATAPLAANQFAFFATRSHHALSSEALRAFGAKVNGVKRATVDMTAPPAGGTGVRLYLERGGVTAADDSMQLVGDVDLRDSASDALNTGIRGVELGDDHRSSRHDAPRLRQHARPRRSASRGAPTRASR